MLYTYKELEKKYRHYRAIDIMLKNNELYKIERGIYSDSKNPSYLEIINFKYPNAIFTLESAFYYHNLTDVIPDKNVLALEKDSTKIKDDRIKVVYSLKKYLELGKTTIEVDGVTINIYDKERMLIELIRNRNSIGFDYYKEIINNYREIRDELDIGKIADYISVFPTTEHLYEVIMKEVF